MFKKAIVLAMFLASTLIAGTTGKIVGRVIDAKTKEPLPGASVQIVGTTMGAYADVDGYYVILNIPPGVYTLKASFVGYREEVVENVRVQADITKEVDFQLTSATLKAKEVVVVAKKALVETKTTTTMRIVESSQLEQIPYTNFGQAVSLQSGVFQRGAGLVVRGGRPDEVAYYIDGLQVTSPLFGGFVGVINTQAIKEFSLVSGGFDAEYGQALSGVVNIVTKEGTNRFSGTIGYMTDDIMPSKYNHGYNRVDVSSGFPVPFIKGKKVKAFVSGYVESADDRGAHFVRVPDYPILHAYEVGTPQVRHEIESKYWKYYQMAKYWHDWYSKHPYGLPHNDGQEYYLMGKLTFQLTPSIKTFVSGFITREQHDNYANDWKYFLDHYRSDYRKQYQIVVGLNHLVKNNLFYNLRAGMFTQIRTLGPKDVFYDLQKRQGFFNKLFTDLWIIDPGREPGSIYYQQYYYTPATPWGWTSQAARFYTEGYYRAFNARQEVSYNLKGDVTWQTHRYHELKTGFEGRFYNIDYYEAVDPQREDPWITYFGDSPEYLGPLAHDSTAQPIKPYTISYYFRDKMEFKGLIVNAGLRFDYMNANAYFVAPAILDTTVIVNLNDVKKEKAKPKFQISPRLGIGFPISDRQTVHFSYGYFFQVPPMMYMFDAINLTPQEIARRGNTIVGNPDMKAEKSIQYEVGITTQLTTNSALGITAFYKDIYNWPATRVVSAIPGSYFVYVNADWGNVKGVEVDFKKIGKPLSVQLSYTLQYAFGTGTDVYDYYRQNYYYQLPTPKRVYPLNYDRRHSINLSLTYFFPDAVMLGPITTGIFKNTMLNLVFNAHSGEPYTPRTLRGELAGDLNSKRLPWFHSTDMKLTKSIAIAGRKLNLELDVYNLFNVKNITNVYSTTGKPDDAGSLYGISPQDFVYPESQASLYRVGGAKYDPRKDINGDGILTPEELYQSYCEYVRDYMYSPFNFGAPRRIRIGFSINF